MKGTKLCPLCKRQRFKGCKICPLCGTPYDYDPNNWYYRTGYRVWDGFGHSAIIYGADNPRRAIELFSDVFDVAEDACCQVTPASQFDMDVSRGITETLIMDERYQGFQENK